MLYEVNLKYTCIYTHTDICVCARAHTVYLYVDHFD